MCFRLLRSTIIALAVSGSTVFGADLATATSQGMAGRQLYSLCSSNVAGKGDPIEAGECLGYIVGISDTFDCVESNHGFHWNVPAAGGSQMKLVTAVMQWLDANPSAMDEQAHRAVGAALQHAFPCK